MELSGLIKPVDFGHDTRGVDLYYRSYTHRISFKVKCIHFIRYQPTVDKFDKMLGYQLYTAVNSKPITWAKNLVDNGADIDLLRRVVDWRANTPKNGAKLVISRNTLTLYFNDPSYPNNFLTSFPEITRYTGWYRVRHQNHERGVVYLTDPKYKYRVYFSWAKLHGGDIPEFYKTTLDYGIKMCPSLDRKFRYVASNNWGVMGNYPSHTTGNTFYINYGNFADVKSEELITVLALKYPQLINKVCRIEPK